LREGLFSQWEVLREWILKRTTFTLTRDGHVHATDHFEGACCSIASVFLQAWLDEVLTVRHCFDSHSVGALEGSPENWRAREQAAFSNLPHYDDGNEDEELTIGLDSKEIHDLLDTKKIDETLDPRRVAGIFAQLKD